MHFVRLGEPGAETPAAIGADGAIRDLRPLTTDIDAAFFESCFDGAGAPFARVRSAVEGGELPLLAGAEGARTGPPIARPGAVVCIGMNYAAHAAESGSPPPADPPLFFKHPNTVVGPDDDVLIPPGAEKVDWEVELAVVIGRRARYLESAEEAAAHIAGYTVANDVSERYLQLDASGGQWSKGKSCETFTPTGPRLVPAADLPAPPGALQLRSWVNGEPRQDSTTADMIVGAAELVRRLSRVMVLDPGDLVLTGTPEGVAMSGRFPYLAPGDSLELEIAGLGRQHQTLRKAT